MIPGFTTQPSRAPFPVDAGGRALTRTKLWVSSKQGRHITQIGRIAPPSVPAVHHNSVGNADRALRERVYYVKNENGEFVRPPQPVPNAFGRCAAFRTRLLGKCVRLPSLPVERFPERYKDARKRMIYKKAVSDYLDRGVLRSDFHIKGFVKDEKLNLDVKADPVPRAIHAQGPVGNVVVGSIISHREHMLFEAIDSVFEKKTVMKGLNADGRGRIIAEKWHSFVDPVGVGLDASRFDQHCSVEALEFENTVHLGMCTNDGERRDLARWLEWCLHTEGRMVATDGMIKFEKHGGRHSGCMNTSSGNIIIMCSMFWSFMQQFDIHWDFVNDGDDCVLFLERSDYHLVVDKIPGWFRDMGFTMTVEQPAYDLEHVEFCQSRPVWTPEGYLMVRNPHTALVKDSVYLGQFANDKEWGSWMRSVGMCGLSLAGRIPMYQDWYTMYLRSSVGYRVNRRHKAEGGLKLASLGMKRDYGVIHQKTRYSFYVAFGILPDAQIAAEDIFRHKEILYQNPVLIPEGLSSPSFF